MNPLISVIVPVYNNADHLKDCIKSLKTQTYDNIELIFVNDGSTDDSQKLIEQEGGIELISKDNGGAASARNRGIDEAKGEYLTFVDADDYVAKDYIETLYDLITKYDVKISFAGVQMTSSKDIPFEVGKEDRLIDNDTIMYRLCNQDKMKETIIPCKLYHKSLFENFRFPEGMTYEDLASTYKLFYKAGKAAETDNTIYAYFMSEGSVMRKHYDIKNFRSENRAWDERIEFYETLNSKKLYEHCLVSAQRNRIANYCKCRKYIGKADAENSKITEKFKVEYKIIKSSTELSGKDKILFRLFDISPEFCYKVLWPLYDK
ncbi:MAG: glycosyltransferase [Saccharofermentans sp.]|nr:glycosyltransferase [Saccharofermentans sp.]